MNGMRDPDPLDERLLRDALRLDAAERPARLDARAIARRAARRTPLGWALAGLRALAVAGLAGAVEIAVASVALGLVGDWDATGLLGAAIAGGAWGLTLLSEAALLLMSPTVALATLAALLFATVHEYARGREPIRVHAS